jgi:hypothetical protein
MERQDVTFGDFNYLSVYRFVCRQPCGLPRELTPFVGRMLGWSIALATTNECSSQEMQHIAIHLLAAKDSMPVCRTQLVHLYSTLIHCSRTGTS